MLTTRLEDTWNTTTDAEKHRAIAHAEDIIGNLVHYPIAKRRYYRDDVERLAAELVWYREREPAGVILS